MLVGLSRLPHQDVQATVVSLPRNPPADLCAVSLRPRRCHARSKSPVAKGCRYVGRNSAAAEYWSTDLFSHNSARRLGRKRVLHAKRARQSPAPFPVRYPAPAGLESCSIVERDTDRDCSFIKYRDPSVPFQIFRELSNRRHQRSHPERFGGVTRFRPHVALAVAACCALLNPVYFTRTLHHKGLGVR